VEGPAALRRGGQLPGSEARVPREDEPRPRPRYAEVALSGGARPLDTSSGLTNVPTWEHFSLVGAPVAFGLKGALG